MTTVPEGDGIDDTVRKLRALNFRELISLDHPAPETYSFREYRGSGERHPSPKAFCHFCDQNGLNTVENKDGDSAGYRLVNMSHGAHARDFLDALADSQDTRTWHAESVMFVFETPSGDYPGLYADSTFEGTRKRPATQWYWVHSAHEVRAFPDSFQGMTYGDLIRSVMLTFRLANIYATNLVKCGMNKDDGLGFKGIAEYQDACVETCYARFLAREIEIMNPKVIFAFGSNVEVRLRHLSQGRYRIQQLPHPAGRRRGFRDEYYKVLYFWLILRTLHDAGIVPEHEALEHAATFLRRYAAAD